MINHLKQRGFSIIELMVGAVVGLLLAAIIIAIADSSKQAYRQTDNRAQLQDNGRFAMDQLVRAIRGAGFLGCTPLASQVVNNLNPAGTGYNAAFYDFSTGFVSGTDNVAGGGGPLAGTDTISLKSFGKGNNGLQVITPYMSSTTANVTVSANTSLNVGDIVVVGDCQSADIFQINSGTPTTGTLVHGAGSVNPGNATNTLSKVYQGGSYVYELTSATYSVQTGADGAPALFVTDVSGTQELVPGIENIQFLYGEDTNNDGVANRYVTASNVSNLTDIVSVQVSVVARSSEDNLVPAPQSYTLNGQTITPADKRVRRVYTSIVNMRNYHTN